MNKETDRGCNIDRQADRHINSRQIFVYRKICLHLIITPILTFNNLSVYPSIYIFMSLTFHLSIYLSIYLSTYLFIPQTSINISIKISLLSPRNIYHNIWPSHHLYHQFNLSIIHLYCVKVISVRLSYLSMSSICIYYLYTYMRKCRPISI